MTHPHLAVKPFVKVRDEKHSVEFYVGASAVFGAHLFGGVKVAKSHAHALHLPTHHILARLLVYVAVVNFKKLICCKPAIFIVAKPEAFCDARDDPVFKI